ncbi:hypothetical protein EV715DRAFT_276786 [Schizophyllum commune]
MDISHYPTSLGDTRGGGIPTSSHPLATHGGPATHDVFPTHAGPSASAASTPFPPAPAVSVPVIPSATPSAINGDAPSSRPLAYEATEIISDDDGSAQQQAHQSTAQSAPSAFNAAPTAPNAAPTAPNASAQPNASAPPNPLRRRGRPLGLGPRAHFEALRVCQNPALLQNGNNAEIELDRLRKEREQREIEESHRTMYKYVLENEQRHVKAKSFEASVLALARAKALREQQEKKLKEQQEKKLKEQQEKAQRVKAKGGKRKVKALSQEEAERKAREAKERELKRLARTPKRPPPSHGYDTRLRSRWESSGSSSNSIGTTETAASFVGDAMVVDDDGLVSPLTSEDELARQVEEDKKRFQAAAPAAPTLPAPAGRFAGPGLRAAQAARADANAADPQVADADAMDTRPDNGDVPTEPDDDAGPTEPAADAHTQPADGARTEPDNDDGRPNADEQRRASRFPHWKGWVNLEEEQELGLRPYNTLPPDWARAKAFPLQRQKTEPDL